MKTITLEWIADPGHEWLGVPGDLIRKYDLLPKLTVYSYFDAKRDMYHLEGDCDAAVLIDALHADGFKTEFTFKEARGDAYVRKLPRLKGPTVLIFGGLL